VGLGEFELIARHFDRPPHRPDVALGVGDDAALLRVPPGHELVVAIDGMVEGVHFPLDTDPAAFGHKLLAVNLSDLAAMGAEPAWATLFISLPAADEAWVAAFAAGLFALAGAHGVDLVGGDTVRGPRSAVLQAHGFVPAGQALRRDGARPGDLIVVTGTLGDGGAGLAVAEGRLPAATASDAAFLRDRLDRPTPRLAAGVALRGLASAAIDVSDGLAADLGHILERSAVGASLEIARLPLSAPLSRAVADPGARWELALGAGDDYELCVTLPPERWDEAAARLAAIGCPATVVGRIDSEPGLRLLGADAGPYRPSGRGFDHFAGG
jgi:thiamine-monophosphate kinase